MTSTHRCSILIYFKHVLQYSNVGNASDPSDRGSDVGNAATLPSPTPMARLKNYGSVVASPGGRSFYSNPRKRTRSARAPVTPALKSALAKGREARRAEYKEALKDARDVILKQAMQLREVFGGHSANYYTQEILQRGRLERARRKPSRWNAYLRQQLKARNAGMKAVLLCAISAKISP